MSKSSVWKTVFSVLFALLVFGAYGYMIAVGDFTPPYLKFGCVGACFLFSLIFIKKNPKKILITFALATNVAADYFLVFNPTFDNALFIGVCLLCGVQLFFALYTLSLAKGNGGRVVNIALRVALCLLAYFILPKYFLISTLEMIYLMYLINVVVTFLILIVHIKTEWLTLLGFFILTVYALYVGLLNGGIALFGLPAELLDLLTKVDLKLYAYVPSLFIIALSSVWTKKKTE